MKFAFLCREPIERVRKRIAVIGAGPAGLTVAGYFACRGYEVDVFDKLPYPGGLMTFAIPRTRIALNEVVEGWRDLEQNLGVRFYLRAKVSLGEGRDEGDEFVERRVDLAELSKSYNAVVVATGTWRSRRLGVEGEDSANVTTALNLLYHRRLVELGLAGYDPLRGVRRVVVVGAGLSAVDVAEECLSCGVSEVHLVYRRTVREAPAGTFRIRELVARGVRWVELAQPKRVVVENGYARGVEFVRVRLGSPDASGRPTPVPVPGTEFVVEADLIVVAVGEVPTPPIYGGDLVKYVDPSGRLTVGGDYRIPNTNIFAVGDVVTGPSKIGLAIDHALRASKTIDSLLTGERVSISNLVRRLRSGRGVAVEFTPWSSDLAESVCSFLSRYVGVDLSTCTSLAPFTRVFDYGKCMGCETCNAVCSFIHDGRSVIRVRRTDEGLVFPTSCLHCTNARCVAACRRNAIVRGSLGEVLIDVSRCNMCKDCFYACPVRAIRITGEEILNCDLCQPLRLAGLAPACISTCPSRVIRLVRVQ